MLTRREMLRRILPGAAIGGVLSATRKDSAQAQTPVEGTVGLFDRPFRLYDSRTDNPEGKHRTGTSFSRFIAASDQWGGVVVNATVTETEGALPSDRAGRRRSPFSAVLMGASLVVA